MLNTHILYDLFLYEYDEGICVEMRAESLIRLTFLGPLLRRIIFL